MIEVTDILGDAEQAYLLPASRAFYVPRWNLPFPRPLRSLGLY